ncbi:MAG: hypothetical protein DWQ08_10500 [Proteobacteria bacterium]|nr:MAG: hypothetical protein DWQ08_10500 [Pseudomonadota bacterium]
MVTSRAALLSTALACAAISIPDLGLSQDPGCLDDCTRRHPPGFCLRVCSPGHPESGVGWHGRIESGLEAQRQPPGAGRDIGDDIRTRIESDREKAISRQRDDLQGIKSRLFK